MPKPTPGRQYTIVKGDNLSHIARAAYGVPSEWRRIWKANKTTLRSGDPNLIFPGEVIIIPGDPPEIEKLKKVEAELPGKDPDDFTVVIEGKEIPVKGGQAVRTADTAADGWVASIARDTSDDDLTELLRPYKYREAAVYLGGKLVVNGRLYGVQHTITENGGVVCDLEGWSYTADMIDSTLKAPYEANKINLETRARDLVEPLGISVLFEVDDDPPFDRVTADKTDTIFDHLLSLAKQRGVLVTSTNQGELLFTKAQSGDPVGTIEEGVPPFVNVSAKFDGRARFNRYKAVGQSPKKNAKTATAADDRVPSSRFLTFQADESTGGDIQKAADWRRSKQIADALTIRLPVPSWYAPNGELWQPNTLVTIKSPTIYLEDGFNFLIREVEYEFRDDGTTANLSLVTPETYSGESIVEPW